MKTYTSYDQLPLTLRAEEVAQILSISRAGAYTLFHAEGFPSIRIGRRLIVPREDFLRWLSEQNKKATTE